MDQLLKRFKSKPGADTLWIRDMHSLCVQSETQNEISNSEPYVSRLNMSYHCLPVSNTFYQSCVCLFTIESRLIY